MLAVWRDALSVQRECGVRQCQGRGPHVCATLGALGQGCCGTREQGTHWDPGGRTLVGQCGPGTSDLWVVCRRVCSIGSALPVSAYHTCYDRARVLHECGT